MMTAKESRMEAGEWVLRARARAGGTSSVHYGTKADIEWYVQAAHRRGDEIEEHGLVAIKPPAEDHLQ